MAKSEHPPSSKVGWKKKLALLTAAAMAVGSLVGTSVAPAAAETGTFNPFAVNQNFTIVAQGDVTLNNGELEGSVAALGTIAAGKENYPVVHATGAGRPEYQVPVIDGQPVRILAAELVGMGGFAVTNRDDHNHVSGDSNEANATAKFVNIDGLTPGARGNFVRFTNQANGYLDLEALEFKEADADYGIATERNSVAEYFADLDTQVAQANQCLAAMYDLPSDQINEVTVEGQDQAFVSDFSTTVPNFINYEDIAGKVIKLDRAEGYKPTAEAPLVIRVPAGTTSLGQLNFEGWSPGPQEQQTLARYILDTPHLC